MHKNLARQQSLFICSREQNHLCHWQEVNQNFLLVQPMGELLYLAPWLFEASIYITIIDFLRIGTLINFFPVMNFCKTKDRQKNSCVWYFDLLLSISIFVFCIFISHRALFCCIYLYVIKSGLASDYKKLNKEILIEFKIMWSHFGIKFSLWSVKLWEGGRYYNDCMALILHQLLHQVTWV